MIGIATHYEHQGRIACGSAWVRYKTGDRRQVDCARCRKTGVYRGAKVSK